MRPFETPTPNVFLFCASVHLRPICGPSAAHLWLRGTISHLGHTCYHCKQWVAGGEAHDCWTTTETALTAELSDELREAWERLRETAADFGEQRIYASHHSIMFSRRSCYFFVRPKQKFLELNVFLGRTVQSPQIRKVVASSAVKRVHVIRVQHRDEVEAPITDWLREAYDFAGDAAKPVEKAGAAHPPKKKTATRAAAKPVSKKSPPRSADAKRKKRTT